MKEWRLVGEGRVNSEFAPVSRLLGSLSGLHTEHKWFYDFSLLWIVFTGDSILGTPWLHLAHRHVLIYTVSKKWGISYSYLDLGLAVRNRRSDSQGPVFLDGSHSMELSSGCLSSSLVLHGPTWLHLYNLVSVTFLASLLWVRNP